MESEGPDEGLDLSPFRGEAEEEDVSTEEEEENPNLLPPIHLYNKAFVEPYIVKLDVDAVVKYWLERVENNGLNEEGMLDLLKEYWVKIVPWCFRLELNQSCLHPFKRTALEVDCFLIQPLALFLSGGEKGEKDIVEVSRWRERESSKSHCSFPSSFLPLPVLGGSGPAGHCLWESVPNGRGHLLVSTVRDGSNLRPLCRLLQDF